MGQWYWIGSDGLVFFGWRHGLMFEFMTAFIESEANDCLIKFTLRRAFCRLRIEIYSDPCLDAMTFISADQRSPISASICCLHSSCHFRPSPNPFSFSLLA